MIVSLANRNLNSRGGSSRVCLNILQVMREHGYNVRIFTKTPVNWNALSEWYDFPIKSDVDINLQPIEFGFLGKYEKLFSVLPIRLHRSDLFFNTSADFFPFLYSRSCRNLAYCHFPVVGPISQNDLPAKYSSGLWRLYFEPYRRLLNRAISEACRHTKFLTNSEFSRKAIKNSLGVEAKVVYPPVNVERFEGSEILDSREDSVVTICRFDPSKNIELIFQILPSLPRNIKWHIIGSVDRNSLRYFEKLKQKAVEFKMAERINFWPNASESEIVRTLGISKVYFHPTRGEHFGISIVEAMSAGLVPVVWDF